MHHLSVYIPLSCCIASLLLFNLHPFSLKKYYIDARERKTELHKKASTGKTSSIK